MSSAEVDLTVFGGSLSSESVVYASELDFRCPSRNYAAKPVCRWSDLGVEACTPRRSQDSLLFCELPTFADQ